MIDCSELIPTMPHSEHEEEVDVLGVEVEHLSRDLAPLTIHDNPIGWGPAAAYETDIPYQPFSKVRMLNRYGIEDNY